jgi:hypothetical protein
VPVPDASVGGGFEDKPVQLALSGLSVATSYHFRIVAVDSASHTTFGPDVTFTTLPAAFVDGESVSDVTAESATLEAEINPLGTDTTYQFRYGPTTACGTEECSVPMAPVDIGSGTSDITVTPQHIQGLQPGTEYHYRVVARNALGTIEGQPRSFTTQTTAAVTLLDGRQWELVTPAEKRGSVPVAQSAGHRAIQAAAAGDAFTYLTTTPTESDPAGYQNGMQVLATRGPNGWGSLDIETPHREGTGVAEVGFDEEYELFSRDLSRAVLQPFGGFEPAISQEASEQTAYLRSNFHAGDVNTACTEACYEPLVTGQPGYSNVSEGTHFSTAGECQGIGREDYYCGPKFIAANSDLQDVLVQSSVPLLEGAVEDGLYEWAAGRLVLISVLPPEEGGQPVEGEMNTLHAERAVSTDGSRVYWEHAGHLYLSEVMDGKAVSVRVDKGIEVGAATFQSASADGTIALFTDAGDLYEYDAAHHAATRVTNGAGVESPLLGSSEDGAWVYFVARGVIEGAAGAVGGAPNLYVRHGGKTTLVAVLSETDAPDWVNKNQPRDFTGTSRVSADGRWLAFMSLLPLTGYDNRDAVSGQRDEEVFLYGGESGRLVCASCEPSGARPHGVESPGKVDTLALEGELWPKGVWIAGNIPGWVTGRYASRALSDSGRVFFNSSDGLVAQDVNGQEDVYEFEPVGVGGCTSAAVSVRVGGCVGLVSSGRSGEESGFLDASGSGGDVFFMTSSQLVAADRDSGRDVYDAHECTPAVPCLPAGVAGAPACSSEASCKRAAAAQPELFGLPASATFSGSGNVSPSPPVKGKTAAQVRAEKLSRALKVCRAKRDKRRRKNCMLMAQKQYGAASGRSGKLGKKVK